MGKKHHPLLKSLQAEALEALWSFISDMPILKADPDGLDGLDIATLNKILETPKDHVLVIMGLSHVEILSLILQECFEYMPIIEPTPSIYNRLKGDKPRVDFLLTREMARQHGESIEMIKLLFPSFLDESNKGNMSCLAPLSIFCSPEDSFPIFNRVALKGPFLS